MALRYGRKPPHPRATHPRVVLDAHADWEALAADIPKDVDRTKGLTWPMYLNDQLGDCAEAGAGHAAQAITAWTGSPVLPSDRDVLTLYETVAGYVPNDPSTDNGTNLQDLLTWWSKNSWGGIEVSAFAELRNWNAAAMRACLYYFGTVYVGVNFPAGGIAQFQNGEPWTPVPGDHIDGGHCIVLEQMTSGKDELNWITWGAKQKSTLRWWWTYAEEAWVILTPQVLADPPPGLDAAAVQQEFQELTG